MLSLVGKRLMFAIPTLIGVVIVTFLLTRALPGDPAAYFAGPAANKEAIEQIRKKLGLDKSLIEQFFRYTSDLARGDLGNSLTTGQPVATEIRNRLPASAELTLLGLAISIVIALPLGVLAATRPGSWIDHLCRVTTTAGVSLPVFFTGLVLVYVFYFKLGWSPAPLGRLDVFYSAPPAVTGLYLIGRLDRAGFRDLPFGAEPAGPAGIDPGDLLAGADCAHDTCIHAGGVGIRFHPNRTGERALARHRHRHLRLSECNAAGHHHPEHGIFVSARSQRAGGEGIRLARHRLLRGRSLDLIGFCAGAGLRAHDGGHVCAAQPDHRYPLRRDRPKSTT